MYKQTGNVGIFTTSSRQRTSTANALQAIRSITALAGKVPVKIAPSSESIKAGDYLTSSDTPGRAMKATKAEAP